MVGASEFDSLLLRKDYQKYGGVRCQGSITKQMELVQPPDGAFLL